MEADIATLVLLNELMDSDDDGETRSCVKRRKEKGYFNNNVQELRLEDRFGFREIFRIDITDFDSKLKIENILTRISDLISPKEKLGGTNPVQ